MSFQPRSEEFLPHLEVFWNLRLSCVSFCPVCVCCPAFQSTGLLSLPLCWVFFTFSFHRGSFCWVALLLCLAFARGGQAEVVSARLNLRNGTIYVRGVFNFPSFVSLQQKFEAMDWLILQLSFIWQAKENTSSRDEGWLTPKWRDKARSSGLAPLFTSFFSSPWACPCKLGQPGGLFVLSEVLTQVLGPSFVLFSWAFPSFVF